MTATITRNHGPSMLLGFSGTNVRSFLDPFSISFLATRVTEPGVARSIPWRDGGQPLDVLPVAVVLGSNASGKSNLLRAMSDLRSFVLHSFRKGDPLGGVPRRPFRLAAGEATTFEIDLVLDGVRHLYSVSLNNDRVLEERAVRFPKGKESLMFERSGDVVEFGPALRARGRMIAELLRPNAAFLSTAAATNDPTLRPLFGWFSRNLVLAEAHNRHLRLAHSADMLNKLESSEHALALLRAADLGIAGVTRKPIDPETRDRIKRAVLILSGREGEPDGSEADAFTIDEFGIALQHSTEDGEMFELDHEEESLGTLVWLGLLAPVVDALEHGSVLLADELDASLHPVLVQQLIRLFQNPITNPHRAQLICNAHDLNLVDSTGDKRLIGRDQVWFTEKQATGGTRLYPLLDFNPRRDENVSRRYMQGLYGGIPIVSDAEFAAALGDLTEQAAVSPN
jgi:uncharacterized protein